jgi:hypothetical protein
MKDHRAKYFGILFASVLTSALATLFLWDPSTHGFYPRCMLHQTTGLYCPGCGILRATHELLHGNFARAFTLNPLFVIGLPIVFAWMTNRFIRGSQAQDFRFFPDVKWVWVAAFVIIAFGVARNLPYNTLAWMRP